MTIVDRWLLPDGIDELLPDMAIRVEQLRRKILDLYQQWGYDLVIPPLVEFTDSLLSGTGSDLDLLTFKLTDQATGRMMGVRADVTPQTARIDAHSLVRQGPSRFCYAASVLYTRQRNPLESRCPIQVGVELYGEPGLAADIEVIGLMIETLILSGVSEINLDIGHVGIYRSLMDVANLNASQQEVLFDLLQRKAVPELTQWIDSNIEDSRLAKWIDGLVRLAGDTSVIEQARELLVGAPEGVTKALDELQVVVDAVTQRGPNVRLFLDLGELRGYHYHTGVVFAAFVSGLGQAIGNGGRYDHVGEAFGRSRPATGFNLNLKELAKFYQSTEKVSGIYVASSDDPAQQQAVAQLRNEGQRVVNGFLGQHPNFDELCCDKQLVLVDGRYQLTPAI